MNSTKYFKGLAAAAVALATGATLVAAPAAKAAEPLKVGFVYVSPVGDAGWTYQHDISRKDLEKALGDKVKTSFVESVPDLLQKNFFEAVPLVFQAGLLQQFG